MLVISQNIHLPIAEVEITAIRAMGNGGQRVNKVATAIHLRFNIHKSSLPAVYKERLLAFSDSRITTDGIIIIKAQSYRTQEMNKDDALKRLVDFIKSAIAVQKKRRATKPTRASVKRRLDGKANRKGLKQSRKKVTF